MNEKILIVDDEREIADLLEVYLQNDHFEVYKFYNGRDALRCVEETEIDLAILDVMLPDIDGFRICQKIREKFFFPVIMLTAKIEDSDKIMGLTIGADDYITKPFKMPILHRRIEAALRKGRRTKERGLYNDGYLNIDFDKMTAQKAGEPLSMTPTEYRILRLLIANADRVLTKGVLLEKIWDQGGNFVDEHAVAVNINRLRKKLEDSEHSYIKTLYGMGYQWKGGK